MQTDQEAVHDGPSGSIRLRTVNEVAQDILRVSAATVYELIYQRQLRAKKVLGQWRISERDIEDYLGETEEVAR
jgi:excisionase family DNA binding protein